MNNQNIPSFELVYNECVSKWPVVVEGLELIMLNGVGYRVCGLFDIYEDVSTGYHLFLDEMIYLDMHHVIYIVVGDLIEALSEVDLSLIRVERIKQVFREQVVDSLESEEERFPSKQSFLRMKMFVKENFKL